MTDIDETADTLQYQFVSHQDMIDDCLVNPIPGAVADIVTKVYAEAEHRDATIVQWRITFAPSPARGYEELGSPGEVAYLNGRRVIKMTAHTTGGTGPAT